MTAAARAQGVKTRKARKTRETELVGASSPPPGGLGRRPTPTALGGARMVWICSGGELPATSRTRQDWVLM